MLGSSESRDYEFSRNSNYSNRKSSGRKLFWYRGHLQTDLQRAKTVYQSFRPELS
ncbi:asr0098 [Nostoc sp. PCC 7120 = FACHB-418]|nr:asr0098 [Nostoc sp. PCC 7120 = FACHB-418]